MFGYRRSRSENGTYSGFRMRFANIGRNDREDLLKLTEYDGPFSS